MKTTTKRIVFALVMLSATAVLTSCVKDIKHCTDDAPYYCKNSSKKGCCSYEWTDNHGSCYSSLSYCRQTGWSCTACYREE